MARFLVRPEAVTGDRVRFDPAEAHHLRRVLRLRPGAVLDVGDGAGRRFSVRLEVVDAPEAWGTILAAAAGSSESPCAITLAQAVLKGDRMAWLIQKATELGVHRIVPVETRRVVARREAGPVDRRQTRWARVAREAVKQCERDRVPAVDLPRPLHEVLAEARRHDLAWLLWERGGVPLGTAARAAGQPCQVLLLVGPEGGFTDEEVARAREAGVQPVGLGPRVLRAESAGLTAVALCQFLFGDLGCGIPPAGR